MTCTEDEFRRILDAEAADITADSVPPLSLAASRPAGLIEDRVPLPRPARRNAHGLSRLRGHRPTVRLVAPLAAAIAVIVVIAIAASLAPGGPSPRPAPSAQASELFNAVPRYYVDIEQGSPSVPGSTVAVARETRTGAAVAIARSPKSYTFAAVAAGADDRTFILEGNQGSSPRPTNGALFRARLDPADHTMAVTALDIHVNPAGLSLGPKLALSANGTELAVGISMLAAGRAEILVYSLTDHTVRTWTGPGSLMATGQAFGWGQDGALAFWYSGRPASSGVRILNTHASSRDLLKASRRAIAMSYLPGGFQARPYCVLSGNGATIATVISNAIVRRPRAGVTEIAEFSAATGARVRLLPRPGQYDEVMWSNESGDVLIGTAPIHPGRTADPNDYAVGVLTGSRFAPIPRGSAPWLAVAF